MKNFFSNIASSRYNALIIWILRIVVGGTFVFSGFTKAIDPWGGMYKIQEYFSLFGFDWAQFMALSLNVIQATIEFVLGVMLLTGSYRRITTLLLSLIMLFMLPLTFYLAISGGVADCGCFGEALVLSNWGTFFKNVVLSLCLAYLLCYNTRVRGMYAKGVQWIAVIVSLLFPLYIAFIGYYYQPLMDFRPYPVGAHLISNDDTGGIAIYDDDDNEVGYDLIADDHKPRLLLLFPEMGSVNIASSYLINDLYEIAQKENTEMIAITAASDEDVAQWKDLSMARYPIYFADDVELKMVARGNPALVMLRGDEIMWKVSLYALEGSLTASTTHTISSLASTLPSQGKLNSAASIYLALMILLLVDKLFLRFPQIIINFVKSKIKIESDKKDSKK